MGVFLVTWDLNREKLNYDKAREAFIARLDKFVSRTDTGLDSVSFVSTSWGASKIKDYLREAQDENDTLFVVKIHAGAEERNGWLNKATWTWIQRA